MRRSWCGPLSLVLCTAFLSACSFAPPPEIGDGGDDDAAADGAVPDAAPPRFERVFHSAGGILYMADVDEGIAGATVGLNPSTSLQNVTLASSGRTAAFTSDAMVSGRHDAYVVTIDTSGTPASPRLISADHGGTGNEVRTVFLLRGGDAAIYAWGQVGSFGDVYTQYYFVDLTGSAPGTPVGLTGGNYPYNGIVSPDGTKFAFTEGRVLYVVDVSGTTPSSPIQVTTWGTNTELYMLQFSPSSDKLSFVSDRLTNDVYELFVVDVSTATPGAVERASGPLASGYNVPYGWLNPPPTFSPDGRKLAYLVYNSNATVYEVYVVDVSGPAPGTAHRVNETLVAGGSVLADVYTTGSGYAFSPDGTHIAYLADQRINDVGEVFLVDVSGATPGSATRLSGALVTGGDAIVFGFSPDGSALWYVANQRSADVDELFYVNLRGAQPAAALVVNGPLAAGGAIGGTRPITVPYVAMSRDGHWIAYSADQNVDGRVEMFVADVSTGTPAPPAPAQVLSAATSYSYYPQFAADGSALFWTSWLEQQNQWDLWFVDLASGTPGTPTKLNTQTPVGTSFWLRP